MNGEIPLDEVYARRLEIIRPTHAAIDSLARRYLETIVDGTDETIYALKKSRLHHSPGDRRHRTGTRTSRETHFGVTLHAVPLRFTASGDYEDFDRRSLLARPRGKEIVVRDIRARTKGKAAFVGDGVSDLEAKPAVDLFVGFGGVHTRTRVRDNADVFVADPRLDAVLPHLL